MERDGLLYGIQLWVNTVAGAVWLLVGALWVVNKVADWRHDRRWKR